MSTIGFALALGTICNCGSCIQAKAAEQEMKIILRNAICNTTPSIGQKKSLYFPLGHGGHQGGLGTT